MSNPYKNVLDTAADLMTRAYTLRKEFMLDLPRHDDVVKLYEDLRLVRNGLDRLEMMLSDSIRLKSRVEILKSTKAGAVEDAEIEVSDKTGLKKDYQSARDSAVALNAKTITQRRELRQVSEAFTEVSATVDVIRNFHRGLEGRRQDLISSLKALQFLSVFEK